MDNPKQIAFCVSQCGIANRLRALIGYMAVTRVLGIPFLVHWHQDGSCPEHHSALFQLPGVEWINLRQALLLKKSAEGNFYSDVPWYPEIGTRLLDEADEPQFLRQVCWCIDHLTAAEPVANAVDDFLSGIDVALSLGLHIRHTDNLTGYARWTMDGAANFESSKISQLSGFFRTLNQQADAGRACLLATDDPVLEKSISQQYGQLVSVFPKRRDENKGAGRLSASQEAIADLLLLGRCSQIVGTYYSSFGQFAAIWADRDFCEVQGVQVERRPPFQSTIDDLRPFRTGASNVLVGSDRYGAASPIA